MDVDIIQNDTKSMTKTAIDRVYQELRQKIIKGEFSPGERLKVETLKPLFDTGASPIREALSLLTSNKLVERIDQKGFRVSAVSAENFNEIFMLRCNLESLALRKSIELGDNAWEEKLVLLHHRLSRTSMADFDVWEPMHKSFHMCLLEACQSPILLSYCNNLYDQNIRYRFLAEKNSNYNSRDVRHEHDEVFNATINRKADLAVEILLRHYTDTGAFLRESFKTGGMASR
ncbi:GntR family transcriptional regulator [Marinomonas ushuaiensis DSM 15871]|uniref:GntR family transcriptional regulator n=1 Tax=Marinomonas ushuaiensis DSM 15871 TaxID=1122207 RepID=X7E7H9_9GAMM|nr:GntR family transcriptional regulator [Marinomonas ushuaiensis]ETX11820.1 GntR family transcriptional regulator [Marinomonas ushuaiensis DSM 15871]